MARFEHLPVYKASYDLWFGVFHLSRHFKREFKYTIGERLQQETLDLITNIYRANSRKDKRAVLEIALENIEVIRLLLRLLKDLKQINLSNFARMNQQIELVARQLGGWHKSILAKVS